MRREPKKKKKPGSRRKNGERRESKKKKGEIREEILQRALLRRHQSGPLLQARRSSYEAEEIKSREFEREAEGKRRMEPATALELVRNGVTLLLLDVPQFTLIGIDTHMFSVGPVFKGIKMIPPGPHYVYYSSSNR